MPGPQWHPTGYSLGWAATASVLCGGMVLAAKTFGLTVPGCTLRSTTGVPCPACGLSRLGVSPFDGRALEAATADPAGAVLLFLLAVVAVDFAIRHLTRRPASRSRLGLVLAVIALVGVHWITTMVTGGVS